MSTYDCGNSSNDEYVVEALRRAIVEGNQDAWVWVQQYLGEAVRRWLYNHPSKEAALRLDSEEHYVAGTFKRFRQLIIDQQLEFSTFATALPYLHLSLNGAILDMLRASSRPKEVQLPQTDFLRKQQMEDETSCNEVWESLQRALLNVHEQRLAYLLFHCGLKPREILHYYSHEFCDVCEINRLRRNIIERLLPNVDHLQQLLC
jgi:hypothetical protein